MIHKTTFNMNELLDEAVSLIDTNFELATKKKVKSKNHLYLSNGAFEEPVSIPELSFTVICNESDYYKRKVIADFVYSNAVGHIKQKKTSIYFKDRVDAVDFCNELLSYLTLIPFERLQSGALLDHEWPILTTAITSLNEITEHILFIIDSYSLVTDFIDTITPKLTEFNTDILVIYNLNDFDCFEDSSKVKAITWFTHNLELTTLATYSSLSSEKLLAYEFYEYCDLLLSLWEIPNSFKLLSLK